MFRIFRGEQRAIGEVMGVDATIDGNTRRQCVGYAAFVEKRRDPAFSRWFQRLEHDVGLLAAEPGRHDERLYRLQQALIDLVDFLDEDYAYFPKDVRGKLTALVDAEHRQQQAEAAHEPTA